MVRERSREGITEEKKIKLKKEQKKYLK